MGFVKYTISLVMIAVFVIALTMFVSNFANDNNTGISIDDDSAYTTLQSNMSSNVESFYSSAETASTAYQESTVSSQTESSEGGTQFKVTPASSLSMVKDSIGVAWKKIFGEDSGFGIIFTALLAALGFIMIAYAYKAWAGRNPD